MLSEFNWMPILALGALAILGFESFQGWRTGRIEFRALQGDRANSPTIYWFIMGMNGLLIAGVVLAFLGIYGDL